MYNVGNVLDFMMMPMVLGVYGVFWCWELGIPCCQVFLVGRFFGSLWVFISFGGIWDWVTRIQKYEHCNCYLGV
jgi:hypothetical protein